MITRKLKLVALVAVQFALIVPMQAVEHTGFSPDQTIVYKVAGDVQLELYVFNPPGHQSTDQRPAIVFFHGGGWINGSPSQFFPHSEYLAKRGMVAISAEYRLKSKHGTNPREAVIDGKSAIRWVRQNAARLGIDPARMAAGGGSAGGQVAAATATSSGFNEAAEDPAVSPRPDALVLFNPVFDNGPDGFEHNWVKAYWEDFSPMHNIDANTPPTIVFLGTEDNLIPVSTAEEYKHRMEANGRRCELHLYDGEKHGFFNFRNEGPNKMYLETVREMELFLISLGYLEAAPK